MGSITPPDYPTLFFFEAGEWWDYAMLLVVVAALAFTAWLAQRNMWVVLAVFVIIPVALTIFWRWRGPCAWSRFKSSRGCGTTAGTC